MKSKYFPFTSKILAGRFKTDKYTWNDNGVLIDITTGEKVIANPKTAGQSREWVINFQPIYNNSLHPQQRALYMKIIKDNMKDWVDGVEPFTQFPLQIELFIYAESMPVDVDNKGCILFKCFSDLLTILGKIPDDNSEYITDTGRTKWIKTPKHKEKMEFVITEL